MNYIYCVCDSIWILTIISLADRIIGTRAQPRWGSRVTVWVKILVAVLVIGLNEYNVMFVGASVVPISNVMMLISALLVSTVFMLLYQDSWWNCFQTAFCLWGGVWMVDFAIQSLLYMILDEFSLPTNLFISASYYRCGYLLLFTAILWVLSGRLADLFAGYLDRLFRWKHCGVVIVIGLWFVIIYFQRIYMSAFTRHYIQMWWILVLIILMFLVAFYIGDVTRRIKEGVKMQQQQVGMLEEYYRQVQRAYQERSILIHDMKKHMSAMQRLAEQENAQRIVDYIQDIGVMLKKTELTGYTQHPMVDAILNSKKQEAEEAGIQVELETECMPDMTLSDAVVCAVFANLLDNAIEANLAEVEKQKRWIRIRCVRKSNMLVFEVSNPLYHKIVKRNELPVTTKKEGEHGLGLASVRSVVRDHGGHLTIRTENEIFFVQVYMKAFEDTIGG